jgi:hypothetical protein
MIEYDPYYKVAAPPHDVLAKVMYVVLHSNYDRGPFHVNHHPM